MNRLPHRLIAALIAFSLPSGLHAEENRMVSDLPETASSSSSGSAADTVTNEITSTDEAISEAEAAPDQMDESLPDEETADQDASNQIESSQQNTETDSLTPDEMAAQADDSSEPEAAAADQPFTINSFEIEGNLLLPLETIEKALQPFIGDNRNRDDLFSIRHTIIKSYRKAELFGVAVAVPVTGENGAVMIRIFEDDIDAYPEPEAKQNDTPTAATASDPETPDNSSANAKAAASAEGEPIATGEPATFAISSADESVETVVFHPVETAPEPEEAAAMVNETVTPAPEASQQLAKTDIEQPAAATEPVSSAEPAPVQAEKAVQTAADQPEKVTGNLPSQPEKPANTATTEPESEVVKPAPPPAVEQKRVSQTATPRKAVTPKTVKKAETVKVSKAKERATMSKKSQKRVTEAEEKEVANSAAAPIIDVKQGSFDISGFEIFGNSLISSDQIQQTLQPYIGQGKTYADLVNAKQDVSQLYRKKGYKMVAIGMPAKLFGDAIPVRIYELKRKR